MIFIQPKDRASHSVIRWTQPSRKLKSMFEIDTCFYMLDVPQSSFADKKATFCQLELPGYQNHQFHQKSLLYESRKSHLYLSFLSVCGLSWVDKGAIWQSTSRSAWSTQMYEACQLCWQGCVTWVLNIMWLRWHILYRRSNGTVI